MREPQLLTVIYPREGPAENSVRLSEVLGEALHGIGHVVLTFAAEAANVLKETEPPRGRLRPVLFVIALGRDGVNLEYMKLLRILREDRTLLEGCAGGVITDGESDLYTKAVSRELVFTANRAGCAFVGRPLVEGTGTLSNFSVVAQILDTDKEAAYRRSAVDLVRRILLFCDAEGAPRRKDLGFYGVEGAPHRKDPGFCSAEGAPRRRDPAFCGAEGAPRRKDSGFCDAESIPRRKILVLHASIRKTSNTLAVWDRTEKYLKDDGIEIRTISLQNGTLYDCAGCPYHTCLHYGEQGSCFYGGVITEEVYPAVREADALVMLCANYNDALAANLTAFINRLTALFRQTRFYDKALFAVVVSGYSGGDLVAEQLIAALNMNKSFYLPPRFALLETANHAGQAMTLPGIGERIRAFAENIRSTLEK